METLARTIIQMAKFLELSEDDILDPDVATRVLEDMSATLQACTREEQEALRTVVANERSKLVQRGDVSTREVAFLEDFMSNIGMR